MCKSDDETTRDPLGDRVKSIRLYFLLETSSSVGFFIFSII